MGLQSGHLTGNLLNPIPYFWEWFRPLYPAIYARVATDRKIRDANRPGILNDRVSKEEGYLAKKMRLFTICFFAAIFVAYMSRIAFL